MSGEEKSVDEHVHNEGVVKNRDELNELLVAIHTRLSRLSLPTPNRSGILGRLKQDFGQGLGRSATVHWKNHGVVVSNASLAKYRGASLPVEIPMAELVVMALDEINREVETCSRAFKRYLYGRLAQALNNDKPKSPEAIVLCLANAAKLAIEAPDCPSLWSGQ